MSFTFQDGWVQLLTWCHIKQIPLHHFLNQISLPESPLSQNVNFKAEEEVEVASVDMITAFGGQSRSVGLQRGGRWHCNVEVALCLQCSRRDIVEHCSSHNSTRGDIVMTEERLAVATLSSCSLDIVIKRGEKMENIIITTEVAAALVFQKMSS